MQIIRDQKNTEQIKEPEIKSLVSQRIQDLGGEAFDANALGYFLVIEAGDTLEAIGLQLGFDILRNRLTGVRYDQTAFTPSFEFIEEFPACYDMVFILSDDGYGVEVFIPKSNTPADIQIMCRMYAFIAP